MTTGLDREKVRTALQQSGSAWLFKYWEPHVERKLEQIAAEIQQFTRAYEQRFGERPDPFELLSQNPSKGAAFFELDALESSLEIKIMIWRILSGCEIVRVEFRYEQGKPAYFSVTLRSAGGDEDPPYVGKYPWDFRTMRHFAATYDNLGYPDTCLNLSGYYAMRHRQ
jgi:hypothetical protein